MQSRGGKRRERKKKFEPLLPSVMMGNVRSLGNKMDELEVLTRDNSGVLANAVYCVSPWRGCASIFPTPSSLPIFQTITADGEMKKSCRNKGGAIAVFVSTT